MMRSNLRGVCARFLAVLLAAVVLAPAMGLAPEPDPVSKRWQLEVTPGDLRVVYVNTLDSSGAYVYFTYSVTNHTGDDLEFVPSFVLATDSGLSMMSGLGVPSSVTDHILRSLEHPFMQDQIDILGPIQQGPENAKHGLVVWPLRDFRVDEIRVFGAGFSGETETIELTDPRTGEEVELIFRKTLMMRFASPGEIRVGEIGDDTFRVTEKRWIMR
ncbi:MAG: hypothetical protein Q9O74_12050 [Planctomycetota bacterium]|nr:hypothetical protein [Planctomycetota bacterium]